MQKSLGVVFQSKKEQNLAHSVAHFLEERLKDKSEKYYVPAILGDPWNWKSELDGDIFILPVLGEKPENLCSLMREHDISLALLSTGGGKYFICDGYGGEEEVAENEVLPILAGDIKRYLVATRREMVRAGDWSTLPPQDQVDLLRDAANKMEVAYTPVDPAIGLGKRAPGNFSLRFHAGDGFWVTRSNVMKTLLTPTDFLGVSLDLANDGSIQFMGPLGTNPSGDTAIHRVIYERTPWAEAIVHGHVHLRSPEVHYREVNRWPYGAEEVGQEISEMILSDFYGDVFMANVRCHGFVAVLRRFRKGLATLERIVCQSAE